MKKDIFFLAALALFYGGILFFDLTGADRAFSPAENRMLTRKPKWTPGTFFKEDARQEYEKYLEDQFPGRDGWIMLKTAAERAAGKKDVNGVYFGPGNTLIERHPAKDRDPEKTEKKIARLMEEARALSQMTGGRTAVMLVPSAAAVQPDRLPAFADEFDQDALLWEVRQRTKAAGLTFVDSAGALRRHGKEEIYYGTDHHWTTLGAFYGYQAFLEAYGRPPVSLKEYERRAVTASFYGTLQAKVNLPVRADTIEIFTRAGEPDHSVRFVYEKKEAPSCYFYDRLKTRDAYAFFLDGNYPLLEIEGEGAEEAGILVIKDSYGNCLVPFLTKDYGRIWVVDKRYYRGDIRELAQEYGPADVLYLYSLFGFVDNF